jgi:hypothetical protein
MTAKIGNVRSHLKEELATVGRARSARRSIRGPEPGLGAATMVLLGVTWRCINFRRPVGRIRDRGSMVMGLKVELIAMLES